MTRYCEASADDFKFAAPARRFFGEQLTKEVPFHQVFQDKRSLGVRA